MVMNLAEVCYRLAELGQQAADLAAQQAALQQAVGHHKVGPTDHKAMKAELGVVRTELQAVQASLADAWRQQKHLLASIDTTVAYRMGGHRSWQVDHDGLAG